MDKTTLSERDICTKFITPALKSAGWDEMLQIREEVSFTAGRIIVRGKLVSRGKGKRADYILYYKPNIPIALIEAKDNSYSIGDGMQQGLGYAATLDIPFVFSSNGDGFVFHDRTGASAVTEATLGLDAFPSPADLWARYRAWKGLTPEAEQIVLQDYYEDGSGKAPRYYQVSAVNAAIEAIAKGRDRILLVMATGTGKTYTAFQIIWRLWKAGRKKRILYLADRNVLIDQTMVNDFRPFGGVMAKLSVNAKTIEKADGTTTDLTNALDAKRQINKSYEVYLGLYQAITGPEERQKLFREFSPEFFDLIVIDECHRGSAAEDSAWREILEYFSAATQIGMTATPKETKYVSNIHYFGEPVYTYSLKQGIRDGFLAPYKVIKVHIDRDVQGYRPEKGQLDREGEEVEDRIYNTRDFDRTLVLDDRTKLVARKVTEFLKESGDRFQKTIIFCVDQEHAARMRQALINENADLVTDIADAPDAIARLRRFILNLAVRGKLVPQDPNDEPASELLKRIAVEKTRLVKAGEIRNKPNLPDVTLDEVPYPLPVVWRWVCFGNIADFSAGRTPSRNDTSFWNTGDHAWISIADMEDGKTLEATKETVSSKARANVFKSEPEAPGTMIMSFKLTIGKIARLGIPAFHNEAIISIRPHFEDLDPFLFKVLPELARGGDTKGAIKGATLNRESISNILVPLPPLAEQHRIVAKVDELMTLCDRLEAARAAREATRDRLAAASLARLNAPDLDPATFADHARFALEALPALATRPDQIKQLRQTILNLAVRGKLVPQDPNDEPASELLKRIAKERKTPQGTKKARRNGETEISSLRTDTLLPGGWRWTDIDEIALSMRYGTSTKCEYAASGVPVLRIPNVSGGFVSLGDIKFGPLTQGEARDLALSAGDLLMIRSNGSLNIVGRSAVVTAEAEGMAFAGYLVRLRLSVSNLKPEYVWLALNSTDVRDQIERPIRSAVGLKNVNLTEFGTLVFPLPPLAEQHRIVTKVDALMALCDRLEANLDAASTTRRRLLDALLAEALAPVSKAVAA